MAKQKVGSGVSHGGDHGDDHGGDHGGEHGDDHGIVIKEGGEGRGEQVENFVHHLALALQNHLRDLTTKMTH